MSTQSPDGPETDGPEAGRPDVARVSQAAERRRAPRYRAFVGTGILIGGLAAVLVVLLTPGAGEGDQATGLGTGTIIVLVALTSCLVGALLGGVVAVLVDRRSRTR